MSYLPYQAMIHFYLFFAPGISQANHVSWEDIPHRQEQQQPGLSQNARCFFLVKACPPVPKLPLRMVFPCRCTIAGDPIWAVPITLCYTAKCIANMGISLCWSEQFGYARLSGDDDAVSLGQVSDYFTQSGQC